MLTGAMETSRLACQATVQGDVRVRMPDGLYIESFSGLEALIGQRTTVPILHPITGEVLIEKGKIIVRSLIMKLADTDFEVDDGFVKRADGA